MLFNSYPFIFIFLPIALFGYFLAAKRSNVVAANWLVLASLFFYGWWNTSYLLLLLASISLNYQFGVWIARAVQNKVHPHSKALLACAVTINIAALIYYKYANFFLANVNAVAGTHWTFGDIVLPLGISFFTFTQIAFLVDCHKGLVREFHITHYALFVTYFPHLIAGPILHHKEMMPQFDRDHTHRFNPENIAVGLTIFFIGLFKKVIIADGIAPYVGPVFAAATAGKSLTFLEATSGALSYSLQLYFDFSGYSDMAIGISRLFGIILPLNFHSPYKATNIIEFWRRWHMTLSRFLRDYVYIPLGGNRKGSSRRYANLLATMLLGGLWHGAGWTFVIWGGLHGVYLALNHGWHALRRRLGHTLTHSSWQGRIIGQAITFIAVVVAWVFFRADSVPAALVVLKGMAGINGIIFPDTWKDHLGAVGPLLIHFGISYANIDQFVVRPPINWFIWLLAITWFLPNTQQIMRNFNPALGLLTEPTPRSSLIKIEWHLNTRWAVLMAFISVISIIKITKISEFLYFQF
jgi:D-alanyl-lipoteichoic acid acyltransferase DltB (MBOAT superfamily)